MRWDDFSRTLRFLHVKTMSGEYLFNVDDITGARHQGPGRTMILTGNGDFVVDIGFDVVRVQLAKFAIVHELDPADEAKP